MPSSKWSPNNNDSICCLSLNPFHDCQRAVRSHHFNSGLLQLPPACLTSNFTHFQNASQMTYRKGKSSVFCFVELCVVLLVWSQHNIWNPSCACLYLDLYIILSFIFLHPLCLPLLSHHPTSGTTCFWNRKCYFLPLSLLTYSIIQMTLSIFSTFYQSSLTLPSDLA